MPDFKGTSKREPIITGDDTEKADVNIMNLDEINARVIKSGAGNGLIEFLDGAGSVINTGYYPDFEQVICFTPTSLIMTPNGPKRADTLRAGDQVVTRDNGAKPLAWIGRKTLGLGSLICNPMLAPVTIAAGALGQDLPEHDLTVSPNHRILMRGETNRLLFDASEVLLSAKHLVGRPGITQSVPNSVTYLHLMFEDHELIMSEGAWTESFQPTEHTLNAVETTQREDLLTLFPDLNTVKGLKNYSTVRRSLSGLETETLCAEL